jgi:pimeloyl-ACP methyl ester carboxylesterase
VLAQLQKIITLALLAAASAWLVFFAHRPQLAFAGCAAILLAYTIVLALELIAACVVGKADPAPRPTWRELMSAWLGEALVMPGVFCWRQPFRAYAVPDNLSAQSASRRGVVFVHGFFCNRGFWTPWLEKALGRGHAFIALNLEPLFGSIENYAPQIEVAVEKLTRHTGLPPILICHSMGGLAARAWFHRYGAGARVHHIVTIGTPHRGTWLARFGHGENSLQMRQGSSWLAHLGATPPARDSLFTCWYSNCDNVVFPTSSATLPGADNRLLRGAAHVHMAFLPQVMDVTLALLQDRAGSS